MAKEKTIHTGFRIPESVKAKLIELAETERTTVSGLLNDGAKLIIESYRNRKGRGK